MSSAAISELTDVQVSQYANIGALAILIFDFCITFQDEVQWTWNRPWGITRVIFVISRYLPFVGSGLTAYAALRVSGPCPPSLAENSIAAAEGLLVIRTWAFWQKSRKVLIGLIIGSVVTLIGATSINVIPNHQLIPGGKSAIVMECGFESGKDAALVYLFLGLFECVILFLTAYKRFRDYREIDSSIVAAVYGGSMFYMLCIIAITLINVIVDAVVPVGFTNLFDTLQLVIHSVLASRIVFHLRRSDDHIYEADMTIPALETIQYGQPQMQTNERTSQV
ncbi:hypothetical protein DEU56DRAFT_980465 [Suillus clintonianus]|uniref:uncharacterized protein n=1 Tax=Suillus clintonianus TaxID=1904413 RepID=UPI001B874A2A|nr:uncharacterized protein DEU56DRAFT_980465 [Suillus clintonianus]KAG2138463.1 hypothetical protein DEU56DRAFT_980465 [Suillus clintonianus]